MDYELILNGQCLANYAFLFFNDNSKQAKQHSSTGVTIHFGDCSIFNFGFCLALLETYDFL